MNSKFGLWSLALVLAFLLFALNAFRKEKTAGSKATTGFILWQALDAWLNYGLYPAVIIWLGAMKGLVVMFVVTLISNIAYIMVNNVTETDWTFRSKIVALPVIRDIIGWKIGRIEIGEWLTFVFLSVKFDSFYAINFLYGKQADLRKAKVWVLFLASHAVCNGAWTLLLGGAIALAKALLQA